jgi:hypothetical protein
MSTPVHGLNALLIMFLLHVVVSLNYFFFESSRLSLSSVCERYYHTIKSKRLDAAKIGPAALEAEAFEQNMDVVGRLRHWKHRDLGSRGRLEMNPSCCAKSCSADDVTTAPRPPHPARLATGQISCHPDHDRPDAGHFLCCLDVSGLKRRLVATFSSIHAHQWRYLVLGQAPRLASTSA